MILRRISATRVVATAPVALALVVPLMFDVAEDQKKTATETEGPVLVAEAQGPPAGADFTAAIVAAVVAAVTEAAARAATAHLTMIDGPVATALVAMTGVEATGRAIALQGGLSTDR